MLDLITLDSELLSCLFRPLLIVKQVIVGFRKVTKY